MKNESKDKMELLKTIGNKLQELRVTHQKSTKDISAHLGISSQAYGLLERGKTDFTVSRILDIAQFYKISFSQIIDLENNKTFNFSSDNNTSCTIQNGEIKNEANSIKELTDTLKTLIEKIASNTV